MKTIEQLEKRCFSIFGNNQCYASDSLKEKVLELCPNGEKFINLAYTDYGGTFVEKVFIQYMKDNHPEFIIYESTFWFGENAIVFGKIVTDIIESTKSYLFGFENLEDYFNEKEWEEQIKAAEQYINENDIPEEKKELVFDYFRECLVETFGVDYSENDLTLFLNS